MTASHLRKLSLASCFLLLPSAFLAQAGVASLTGQVTDPSGAILVGAQVTETNIETQTARSTVTDKSGNFTLVGLPVGHYRVAVVQSGFQAQEATLILDPSGRGRQDFHMAVSSMTTQVEVSESGPELARDDASIGTVIDNETIVGTPLYQRNWDDLIRLVPGVQMQRFTQQSGSSVSGSTGLFVIHGVGNEQNDYILDGVDNNTFSENLQELSASASRPSVDVIGEFKLISSPYTAIYAEALVPKSMSPPRAGRMSSMDWCSSTFAIACSTRTTTLPMEQDYPSPRRSRTSLAEILAAQFCISASSGSLTTKAPAFARA
jgi:hypothetical protein